MQWCSASPAIELFQQNFWKIEHLSYAAGELGERGINNYDYPVWCEDNSY